MRKLSTAPKSVLLLAILLAAVLALAGCAGEQATPSPTPTATANTPTADPTSATALPDSATLYRVGLVTDGGKVDDGSLNQAVYLGLQRAAEEFGFSLNTIESVQPGDFATNIETFAKAGYDLIVTVGPLIAETTRAMADAYPDTRFVAVDVAYADAPDNLVGLAFREDQMGFLAGALAGLVSQRKTVGFVAGVDSLAARRLRAGYESGVRYVCVECMVVAIALDSATDPARGRTAALRQMAEGADVIFGIGGATGSGAVLGAAQQGVWAIGVDQDEFFTTFRGGTTDGSGKIVSSAIKRADEAVYQVTKGAVMGSFPNGTVIFDAANDGVGLADFHLAADAVPADVRARVAEIYQLLAGGQLDTGVDPVSGEPLQ